MGSTGKKNPDTTATGGFEPMGQACLCGAEHSNSLSCRRTTLAAPAHDECYRPISIKLATVVSCTVAEKPIFLGILTVSLMHLAAFPSSYR